MDCYITHQIIPLLMKALKELVQIIARNKVKKIELIGEKRGDQISNVNKLYFGILDGNLHDESSAASLLFNTEPNDKKFLNLKSELKRRALNTLFFIDVKKPVYNDYQRAYYTVCKEWAATKIMLGKQARISGIELCHGILKKAIKYEFTDIVVDTSKVLRLHYGGLIGDRKKFNKYNELFYEYEQIWKAENLAEEYYTEIILSYINSNNNQHIEKASSVLFNKIKPSLEKWNTNKLHLYGRLIHSWVYMTRNNYEETISVCQQAIDFFKKKKFNNKNGLVIFTHQQLICYVQIKKFKEGQAAGNYCGQLLAKGSFNWLKNQSLMLILSIHTRHYQTAYAIFQETVSDNGFRFIDERDREMWKVYEAYIHFLLIIGKIKKQNSADEIKKFKLNKFLNEVPILSKEKRRTNIPIIVIQILFLIQERKYSAVIDRIEALEKYSSRYLKKDQMFRSNCFLKMILEIPKSNFHRAQVERKSKKYEEMLKTYQIQLVKQPHEIEIIPYEDLWSYVLDQLENKVISRHRKKV